MEFTLDVREYRKQQTSMCFPKSSHAMCEGSREIVVMNPVKRVGIRTICIISLVWHEGFHLIDYLKLWVGLVVAISKIP